MKNAFISIIVYFLWSWLIANICECGDHGQDWRFRLMPRKSEDNSINIDEFLIGVLEGFRDDMLTGVPELKIPILDPFAPNKPIRVDVDDAKASVHANFTDLSITGLSDFAIENLRADLQSLALRFHLRIPRLQAGGNYSLNGKLIKIIPLRGEGGFWVDSHNLTIEAVASIITKDEHLQLSDDFDVDIDFAKVQMDLENFLGGGRWTEVVIKILNEVSTDLFKKFLPLIKAELNKALLQVINRQLIKVPIKMIRPGSSSDDYIDQILYNVREYIKEKNMDPMELPNFEKVVYKKMLFINWTGEAKMYDGKLWGLSTIHRTDGSQVKSNRTTIEVSAHLGLRNLTIFYKGKSKFMKWGPNFEGGGKIKKVYFYFRIEQSNQKGATPILRDLEIVEMSTVWIHFSGLGPMSWIMKYLMTGMMKFTEGLLVNKITDKMKEFLQKQFEKYSFPV